MTRRTTRLRALVITGTVAFALMNAVGTAGADGCLITTAGLDSSKWNNAYGPIFGDAIGQTFLAEDTIIVAVTVWRPPNNRSVIGAKMFVTDTHLNGQGYLEPDRNRILFSGTVHIYDSDPPGQLIPMRFVIDPPLVLPHRGEYGIMFQAENCWQGEPWRLIVDAGNDDYPAGLYWVTGRASTSCYLPPPAGGGGDTDICFRIEYCADQATTVSKRTWGRLKLLYR